MSDMREPNLKQLTEKHLDETAKVGAALLDTLSDAQLAVLLRSHWMKRPNPEWKSATVMPSTSSSTTTRCWKWHRLRVRAGSRCPTSFATLR